MLAAAGGGVDIAAARQQLGARRSIDLLRERCNLEPESAA
jgi:hypothetical protein